MRSDCHTIRKVWLALHLRKMGIPISSMAARVLGLRVEDLKKRCVHALSVPTGRSAVKGPTRTG